MQNKQTFNNGNYENSYKYDRKHEGNRKENHNIFTRVYNPVVCFFLGGGRGFVIYKLNLSSKH